MLTVYSRTLRRAAEIVGGQQELARRLGVFPSQLLPWLAGTSTPSTEVFLKAVDIVGDYDIQQLSPPVVPPPDSDVAS
jgi:DNA-binding transcriptional regulator YdaS (Cro superfamily)